MKRKLVVFAGALLIAVLGLEAASWAALYVTTGERLRYAELDARRQRWIDDAEVLRDAGRGGGKPTTGLVLHPHLGFVYNPRFDPVGMRRAHTVPVSEWGLLDDKPPVRPRADDEFVIGIFGGSVAFWLSVLGIEAALQEIAKVPELAGKRLVVVRVALGGYKQPQQLMALSYLLALGAHFDAVVNLDGVNEVSLAHASLIPKGIFPFFPREWPFLVGDTSDPTLVRLVGEVTYLRKRRGDLAASYAGSWRRRSAAANLAWFVSDRRLEAEIVQAQQSLASYRPPDLESQYQVQGPPRPYQSAAEEFADVAAVWKRSSLTMHQLCAARGIRYYHFLQPNQYLQAAKPMGAAERKIALQPGGVFEQTVRAGYPLLQAAGGELSVQGVSFHDLTRVFADVREPLYIDDCCHLSVRGNEILARALGTTIARGLRPAG
jgi:hypothetical protein